MTRRKVLIACGILAFLGLAFAYLSGLGDLRSSENDDRGFFSRIAGVVSGRSENVIRVSGNIELVDVEVSFKIGGRVIERLVDEGDSVEANKKIASLESEDLRRDVAAREADFRAAEAAWEEVENGSRKEDKEAAGPPARRLTRPTKSWSMARGPRKSRPPRPRFVAPRWRWTG